MTQTTREQRAPATGGNEQSATDQAKEKVQETAGQVQQQAGEKVDQMRNQAGETVRQQLDTRSTKAGEQVSATADAIRRVGQQLREEGNGTPAQYAERAAEPVERLGRYLTESDGQKILRDAEQFARRRPWVTAVGGATIGFLVARFVKASSPGGGADFQSRSGAQPSLPRQTSGGADGF